MIKLTATHITEVLNLIRTAGIAVAPDQFIAVHDLMFVYASRGELDQEVEAFKELVTPIVAKNAREQSVVYGLIDDWVESLKAEPEDSPTSDPQALTADETDALGHRQQARWYVLVSVLLVCGLFTALLMYEREVEEEVAKPPIVDCSVEPQPESCQKKPPPPEPSEGVKDVSPKFVSVVPLTPGLDWPSLPDADLVPTLASSAVFDALRWTLVVVLPMLFVFGWVRYLIRRQLWLDRRRVKGPIQLQRFRVRDSARGLFQGTTARRAFQALGRHLEIRTRNLDAAATLDATLHNGGLFTPRFENRAMAPEHLVLIQENSSKDGLGRLGHELVRRMREMGLYVEYFYFRSDIRHCFEPVRRSQLVLADLQKLYGNYRLIIISDGTEFFNTLTGQPYEWLTVFDMWRDRALLSTQPIENWGFRENTLMAGGFRVAPFDHSGIASVAQVFDHSNVGGQFSYSYSASGPFPPTLVNLVRDWTEDEELDGNTFRALRDEITQYAGEDGWELFAASAAYPDVYWQLTLYLDSVLQSNSGVSTRDQRLLALARLPWFREGRIPTSLRIRLLRSLPTRRFREVRAALQRLLATALDAPKGEFELEVAVDGRGHKPNWISGFMSAETEGVYRDVVFAKVMKGGKPRLLDINLDRAVGAVFGLRHSRQLLGSFLVGLAAVVTLSWTAWNVSPSLFGLAASIAAPNYAPTEIITLKSAATHLAFSSDGGHLIATTNDGEFISMRSDQLQTESLVAFQNNEKYVSFVMADEGDGDYIAFAGRGGGGIDYFGFDDDGFTTGTEPINDIAHSLDYGSVGAVATARDDVLLVWESAGSPPIEVATEAGDVLDMAFSNNGGTLFVVAGSKKPLIGLNRAIDGSEFGIQSLPSSNSSKPRTSAATPLDANGNPGLMWVHQSMVRYVTTDYFLAVNGEGVLEARSASDEGLLSIGVPVLPTGIRVSAFTISTDQRFLVTWSESTAPTIWRLDDAFAQTLSEIDELAEISELSTVSFARSVHTLPVATSRNTGVALTPRAQRLITTEGDNLWVWSVPAGEPMARLVDDVGKSPEVESMTIHPSGQAIAAILADGRIGVWGRLSEFMAHCNSSSANDAMLGPNTACPVSLDAELKTSVSKPISTTRALSGQIELSGHIEPVRFETGQAVIPESWLASFEQFLDSYADKSNLRFRFVGHTDNQRLPARVTKIYGDSMGLSQARAQVVADYVVDRLKLDPSSVVTRGRSFSDPVAENTTPEGMALNRRVEIEILYDEDVRSTSNGAQPQQAKSKDRLDLELSVEVSAVAGRIDVAWRVPSENVDGTAAKGIGGFRIYYVYYDEVTELKDVIEADQSARRVEIDVPSGEYGVSVVAFDIEGNESARSRPVRVTVPFSAGARGFEDDVQQIQDRAQQEEEPAQTSETGPSLTEETDEKVNRSATTVATDRAGRPLNLDQSNETKSVDCLLPGAVRRLGESTYLTSRRPIRTTSTECEVRGGEFVPDSNSDPQGALAIWMEAAEAGDADAQTRVGEIYEQNVNGTPDYARALVWYRSAARQGNSRAQFNLGVMYENGRGVERDVDEALRWYQESGLVAGDSESTEEN